MENRKAIISPSKMLKILCKNLDLFSKMQFYDLFYSCTHQNTCNLNEYLPILPNLSKKHSIPASVIPFMDEIC